MDGLFANIPGVTVYLDDILITGNDTQSHLEHLKTVLERLHYSGLRLKSEKCSFRQLNLQLCILVTILMLQDYIQLMTR